MTTTKATHTPGLPSPGPWTVNRPGETARPYIVADTSNGKDPMRCAVAFGEPTGGQGWPHIDNDGFYTYANAQANARLIAAAPCHHANALYLDSVAPHLPDDVPDDEPIEICVTAKTIRDIRAAIAKAIGEKA